MLVSGRVYLWMDSFWMVSLVDCCVVCVRSFGQFVWVGGCNKFKKKHMSDLGMYPP